MTNFFSFPLVALKNRKFSEKNGNLPVILSLLENKWDSPQKGSLKSGQEPMVSWSGTIATKNI